MASVSGPAIDLGDLKSLLNEQADEIAESLLGPPNRHTRNRAEWAWGGKDSARLVVRSHGGKLRGSFYSHEADAGGSMIDLIMFGRNCDVAEAVRWAKAWLRLDDATPEDPAIVQARAEERRRQREQQDRQAELEAQNRANYARRLWDAAVRPEGTVADLYLSRTRGIPLREEAWPPAVRFHPDSHSLIVAGTGADGIVQAVQRVFLTAEATKLDVVDLGARRLRAVKQTNGPPNGAPVRLPGDITDPLLFAEGPETGLSVWAATGYETWIALGQVSKLVPPHGRTIVLCRDDDRRPNTPDKPCPEDRHRKLVRSWIRRGICAVQALPWAERRHDGSDFNDVIQAAGSLAVSARIAEALKERPRTALPSTTARAEQRLRLAVGKILDACADQLEQLLNRETFVVAQHVGAGTLDGRRAVADLYAAARRREVSGDAAVRTIQSAMTAGMESPLQRWAPPA